MNTSSHKEQQSRRDIIHDLRNHLSSIMMSCEVALFEAGLPAQTKKVLASAIEDSRHIALLLEKLSRTEQNSSEK